MGVITQEMIINDVIRNYPETMGVFNEFKVDSCCGGGQSIAVTAAVSGVEVAPFIEALNKTIGAAS